MAVKLPRLANNQTITDGKFYPSVTFGLWWDRIATTLENALNDILVALELAGIAVDIAESIETDVEEVKQAPVILQSASAKFPNGRTITQGAGLSITDAGAGSTLTIAAGPVLAAYAGGDTPSAFTLGIVDSANATAWRAAIGAGVGSVTSVDASGGATGLSFSGGPITGAGTLTLSGTLAVANGGTGSGTAGGARTNLGLVIGTDVQAYSAKLAAYAGGDTPSAFTLGILDSVDAAAWRSSIGVAIGSQVQAWGADLDAIAALSGTNTIYYRSAANTWSAVTIGGNLSFSSGTLAVDKTLSSGTYTPTLTGVANVASSTAFPCQYSRVGNIVTVSGLISVTATAAATSTQIGISLPIASNFAATTDCNGAAGSAGSTQVGRLLADITNDRAQMNFLSVNTGGNGMGFTFQYEVL